MFTIKQLPPPMYKINYFGMEISYKLIKLNVFESSICIALFLDVFTVVVYCIALFFRRIYKQYTVQPFSLDVFSVVVYCIALFFRRIYNCNILYSHFLQTYLQLQYMVQPFSLDVFTIVVYCITLFFRLIYNCSILYSPFRQTYLQLQYKLYSPFHNTPL